MKALFRTLVAVAASLVSTAVYAQGADTYPNRPVRVIVGFTAGGPTDVIARLIAQKLSDGLGQQFFVENVPGAGGNIAAAQTARAPADGYTLHVVSTGFIVNPSLYSRNVGYDPVKDFAPVAMLASSPNIISLNPSLPAKTAKELIALVKSTPGKYNYAHPGTGSTPHLNGELFKLSYGLDLTTVPFNGTAQLVTSAIAGDTPIVFTSLPSAMPIVRDGKLRALVVLSKNRVESLPDVPGTTESGIEGSRRRHRLRHRGSSRHAAGDHRQAQRRDQKGRRDGGYQGEARGAGLRRGGEPARRVRRPDQGRDRQMGEGHPRLQHQGRLIWPALRPQVL